MGSGCIANSSEKFNVKRLRDEAAMGGKCEILDFLLLMVAPSAWSTLPWFPCRLRPSFSCVVTVDCACTQHRITLLHSWVSQSKLRRPWGTLRLFQGCHKVKIIFIMLSHHLPKSLGIICPFFVASWCKWYGGQNGRSFSMNLGSATKSQEQPDIFHRLHTPSKNNTSFT